MGPHLMPQQAVECCPVCCGRIMLSDALFVLCASRQTISCQNACTSSCSLGGCCSRYMTYACNFSMHDRHSMGEPDNQLIAQA